MKNLLAAILVFFVSPALAQPAWVGDWLFEGNETISLSETAVDFNGMGGCDVLSARTVKAETTLVGRCENEADEGSRESTIRVRMLGSSKISVQVDNETPAIATRAAK
jgi:hypothetical protein